MGLLEPLFANVTGEERTAGERFNAGLARLYSKVWSAGFLRKILRQLGDESWLCTEHEAGVAAGTLERALEAIDAIRRRGHHRVVVKEALGLAAQNMIRKGETQ